VTVDRQTFIPHASWEFEGDGWPSFSNAEMQSALDGLVDRRRRAALRQWTFDLVDEAFDAPIPVRLRR
jgi:hypothetical protein